MQKVWLRAQEVIGDADGAQRWVNHANRALGGVEPRTLPETDAGYKLVLDTLSRIAYGVYS